MQDRAMVVIIGAGIVGCTTAYYLTKMGWRNIVVIEQGPLFETGGSTSHAPGLVFQVNASKILTEFAKDSVDLYSSLDLDGDPCWYPVGGIEVAWTQDRLEDLKRKVGLAKSWGVEAHLISPKAAQEQIPLLSGKILGAMYVASDGVAKAIKISEALARKCEAHGVKFYGHTEVTGIEARSGHVLAVQTTRGRIETDTVVAAAGIWGPRVGHMVNIPIPLSPMQHLLAVTTPLPELKGTTVEISQPMLRHQDKSMYFRQFGESYIIGAYNHEPIPSGVDDILPHDTAPIMPSIMPWTEEHFKSATESMGEILPCLQSAGLTYKINGLMSFTTDGMPLLGESPSLKGFWSAQAVWISHAGGVAKALAEWMTEGTSSTDLREANISRFHDHMLSPTYIKARSSQQYREVYDIIHPLQQITHPRQLRLSPFHIRQEELGATFFESAGWERPQWYESNEYLLKNTKIDMPTRGQWEGAYWSPIIGAEHVATREHGALFDLTAFTKIEIAGKASLEYLQYITSNQMDRSVGRVIYTSMLNERGGIKCDLTVTRLANDRFLAVTGGGTGPQDIDWMRRYLPMDGSVTITDVSASYCCIGVWGPKARDLIRRTCTNDVSNNSFPYMTSQHIWIGNIPTIASRISYVGELGWELYAKAEYGLQLWDTLWREAQTLGMVAAGGGAFESLRIEKGYRLWGTDIHTEYNPYEAGLGFSVKLNKGEFIGRASLLQIREDSIDRKLSCMILDDCNSVVMGKEPILKDNHPIGYVTSANFGYTVKKSITFGYLPLDCTSEGTKVEIEYFQKRLSATVVKDPLFDPTMERLKS